MFNHPDFFPDVYQSQRVDGIKMFHQDDISVIIIHRSTVYWQDVNLKDIRCPLTEADPGVWEQLSQ